MSNLVDRDLERAEIQATRTWSARSSAERQRDLEKGASLRAGGSHGSISSSSTGSSISSRPGLSTTATASLARTRTHPIEQHRTETHRLQHSQTVGASKSRASQKPLPAFGGGKPYPPSLPEREEYVVEFDGKDDPLHPQNWTFKHK